MNFLRPLSLFLILLFSLYSCGSDAPQEQTAAPTPLAPEVEDDLLTRLSMQLIAKPSSQAHHDQNTIVNYAIDQLVDVKMSPSGLFYQITEAGDQADIPPRWGDVLVLHYRGTFLDGRVFDESKPGKAFKAKLRQVIPGWQEALLMMRKGGKGIFILPSHLAYGPEGLGNTIAPNTILKFEIELVDIDRY